MTNKIILIGIPNAGKTTFFNSITNSRLRTGNFAGVTVDKSVAKIKKNYSLKISKAFEGEVVDLPGVYSLKKPKAEEKLTAEYLKNEFEPLNDTITLIFDTESEFTQNASKKLHSELKELYPTAKIGVHKSKKFKKTSSSEILVDKILTNKISGLLIFILIFGLVFGMVFGLAGALPIPDILKTLPLLFLMFFILSLIEDSGYVSRVEKLFGTRAVIPVIFGYGCTVCAISATRNAPSKKARLQWLFLLPFVSCSSKIPVYTVIVNSFVQPRFPILVFVAIYAGTLLLGILLQPKQLSNTIHKTKINMPRLKIPSLKTAFPYAINETWDFIKRAFPLISACFFGMKFLGNHSLLEPFASKIAIIFKPLGFGDYRIVTAIFCGFFAKEAFVGAISGGVLPVLDLSTGLALLTFVALYSPCMASVLEVRREFNSKVAFLWSAFACIAAYIISYVMRIIIMGLM